MPAKVEHWARKPASRTPYRYATRAAKSPHRSPQRACCGSCYATLSERKFEEIVNQLR